MDKSLLVEVFAPTYDEGRRDGGGKVGEVATGYPVGKDLILTARHVLEPEDRDARYRIAIRWHDYPDAGPQEGWCDLAEEAVVWKGEGPLDAALLRVERPPEVRGAGIVSAEHPRDHTRWAAAGFPRVGRFEGKRHPVSFGGDVYSMSPKSDHFEVTVEASPDTEEGWSGASGMPVFVDGKILGVTWRVPKGFRSGRLHVTPSWKLHEDAGFQDVIGYEDREASRRQAERRLAQRLRGSPRAIEGLVEESGLEGLAKVDRQNVNDVASAILDKVLDLGELIDALLNAHRYLREELGYTPNDAELKDAAQVLVDVAQLLTPVLVDHGMVAGVRRDRDGAATPLVRVPVCLPTAVEVIMAGADGRAARFRPRATEESYAEGVFSLPTPPECGIGRVAERRDAALEHAAAKLTPDLARSIRQWVGDEAFRAYVEQTAARTREERLRAAAVELDTRSRKDGRRFYLALPVPEERAGRNELEALASGMKQDLPPVVCLGVDASFETELRDRVRYGPLSQMLPLQE